MSEATLRTDGEVWEKLPRWMHVLDELKRKAKTPPELTSRAIPLKDPSK